MKNIVICKIENGHPSGVVRYVEMLCRGLKQQLGIKVHVISLDCNILFCNIKEINGEVIAEIPFQVDSKPLRNGPYWLSKYFKVIAELLVPYFKKGDMFLWHVQELFIVKLAHLLSEKIGGIIITHLHIIPWKFSCENNERFFNTMYSQWLKEIYHLIGENKLERLAYPLSDKIVCVSRSAKEHIMSVYGIESKKIAVIYNGLLDVNVVGDKERTKDFTILFAGRVSREKGIICLLNALKKVHVKGYSFELKLAGHCIESMKYKIRTEYRKLSVDILGKISYMELQKLYSICSIGVIPSLHEQCSYVAIEMSMFGMPMIVSDVDALSEMFEDGVNALKIPLVFDEDFGLELDEDKFADAIIRLIENKELQRQLGENAIKNYQENFTLDKMIENTVSLYEQLVEQNNA